MEWTFRTGASWMQNSGNTAKIRPTEAATRGEIAHAIHVFCEEVAK